MSQTSKIPLGPVKLCVDTRGFEDGRLVQFEIWMKKGGEERIVDQVNGTVRSGKGEAIWTPRASEKRDTLKKTEPTEEESGQEEYYFKARIGDLEVQSDTWTFLYPLEIYVKDENGIPLDGVEFEIEFSDGSKEKGKFKKGCAKFKGAPKGKFKLKVKGYKLKGGINMSEITAYGLVGNTITIVEGILEHEISYTVSLKVQPPLQNANYTIEKASNVDIETGRIVYTPIREEIDLLESSDEFRVCISENIGNNGSYIFDKCQFYIRWDIMGKIDIYIPLKIEVTKMAADTPEDYAAEEVSAIVELIDPPENTSVIKGPIGSGRNGANFVAFLKSQVSKGDGGDNCPNIFAPITFRGRCRSVQDDIDDIKKIILDENKRQFRVHPEKPNAVIVPIRSVEERVRENSNGVIRIGCSKILLHFPPIAGNNYRLKITLINKSGQGAILKDKNNPDLYPLYLLTPTITIWKKIKIEMVALQSDIRYEDIKWKVIKSALADAFIEVEEPSPEKRYTIGLKEWMEYLGDVVYSKWQIDAWKKYKLESNLNVHIEDFGKYSFPQAHNDINKLDYIPDSEKLIPPDDNPKNPNITTWTFLENIAKKIFENKLGRGTYKLLANYNPLKGYHLGFCVLICKPPFKGSEVGGLSLFNKMFYITFGKNMESTFLHELGHALFLRHAPTYFYHTELPRSYINIPLILRSEEEGSKGPYWDEHDSEDMVSCIMSYADTNDWHFCGLCLLKLRLYDINSMIRGNDDTLRRT
ncbi:MAG: hypothetical protein QXF82_02695, partial [Nitrososphaeria archaeon]